MPRNVDRHDQRNRHQDDETNRKDANQQNREPFGSCRFPNRFVGRQDIRPYNVRFGTVGRVDPELGKPAINVLQGHLASIPQSLRYDFRAF